MRLDVMSRNILSRVGHVKANYPTQKSAPLSSRSSSGSCHTRVALPTPVGYQNTPRHLSRRINIRVDRRNTQHPCYSPRLDDSNSIAHNNYGTEPKSVCLMLSLALPSLPPFRSRAGILRPAARCVNVSLLFRFIYYSMPDTHTCVAESTYDVIVDFDNKPLLAVIRTLFR